jgi:hypothetical protein
MLGAIVPVVPVVPVIRNFLNFLNFLMSSIIRNFLTIPVVPVVCPWPDPPARGRLPVAVCP